MEVELVKVEVDVVGEAEAGDDAEREDCDGDCTLGQPARPADQARVAAAQLDQRGVPYLQQRLQHIWCSFATYMIHKKCSLVHNFKNIH